MAFSSTLDGGSVYERRVISHVRTYDWPPLQLNFWIFVMLLASSTVVGVFGTFMQTQSQLDLPMPWYFPYYVTVGSLSIAFVLSVVWLIANRRLLPAIVMIGAFMIFVLWMVGLIASSIELWGSGGVQSNCNLQVFSQNPTSPTVETLAWIQQKSTCQSWYLVFAMGLTGAIFLVWVMIMAYQVFAKS